MFLLQLLSLLGLNSLVYGLDSTDTSIGASYLDSYCGPDLYCLPKEDELWYPHDSEFVRWNRYYPTFSTFVNISLFNTKSEVPVEEWPLYKNEGLLVINNIPSSWFIGVNLSANVTQEFYFFITGPYTPTVVIPRGPNFYIQKPQILPAYANPVAVVNASESIIHTSTVVSMTPTSRPSTVVSSIPSSTSSSPATQNSSSTNLSAGAISGITVGSVAGVTIIACLVYFFRRRRRNQASSYETKAEIDSGPTMACNSSADTSGPDTDVTMEMAEPPNPIKRNSLRLTVKGAQELAHTYRKMLTNQETVEESSTQNQPRTLYSDELLRRELAADGHGVKYVSTAPAIVVMGDDQQSLRSMTADTSDSREIP
ncbi:hypothetical protein K493DRAFT_335228 [Basidiobolus meristosporus CBS 931.73]|uniref:Mid2 domain-containing protein n=1 Tax=Basidiobolus meristosporus CBS 931.73 TaxID=1314790 RepID=A0A1Y1YRY4_9FUNG|nr:hypothetical protein K493DRAFT_335228 [Basidiobolus meristosporus CBS 931.73]|eukprot:ORY00791.1 hypothetical protein K493DRAFT_335228 [Basidiobolus meristosporus CBS 931.73]